MSGKGCKEGWDDSLIEDLRDYYAQVKDAGATAIGITLMPAMKRWNRKYKMCKKEYNSGNTLSKTCRYFGCGSKEKLEKYRNPEILYDKIEKVNNFIRNNAPIVIDAAAEMTGDVDDNDRGIKKYYDKDGIHPNKNAHIWISEEIKKAIGDPQHKTKITKDIKTKAIKVEVDKPKAKEVKTTVSSNAELAESLPETVVSRRSNKNDIIIVQKALRKLGYYLGTYGIDGVDGAYGPLTKSKIQEFQEKVFPDNNEEWDGIYGPNTAKKMKKELLKITESKEYLLDFNKWLIFESFDFPKTLKGLLKIAPEELVNMTMELQKVPQNPKWHPEGNTLKHVILVFRRALNEHPDNLDIAMAAFFHDIGKLHTLSYHPKTGQPTAHGHEKKSAELVKKHRNWIKEIGANPTNVYYIVRNHMKMKPSTWDNMRDKKKDKLKAYKSFGDLEKFSKIDKGGRD